MKKIELKQNLRGSALIATLIIASAIAVFVFSIGGATIGEIETSGALEDSTIAFSAAEAGIEEGLLRWRFNRNIELPEVNMTEDNFKGIRVNLTSGEVSATLLDSPPESNATDSVYDLRMWFKADAIGSADLASPTYKTRLFKDQTLELDVSSLRGQTLVFTYLSPTGYAARIESHIIADDGSGLIFETSKQLTELSSGRSVNIGPIPEGSDGLGYLVRIKPFIFETASGAAAPESSSVNYALTPETPGSLVDGGTTYIEATGYYGTAKRKLLAKIDRKSGTILGVFDFVLFSETDL